MHEDRVILESVVAQNRNAILDLHNLEQTHRHHHSSSSSSSHPEAAGTHHRDLSNSTGVEMSPIPDVLPPTAKQEKKDEKTKPPSRRFSRRGVRLGVHMSILDMGAHEAPKGLKDKWIQRSQQGANGHLRHANTSGGLSKISEVDSMGMTPHEEQREGTESKDRQEERPNTQDDSDKATLGTCTNQSGRSSEEACNGSNGESGQKRNMKSLVNSTMGQGLRKMIRHLTVSSPSVENGKQREDAETETKSGNGFRRRLTVLAGGKPPLMTPDFDQEFENGRI